ncbi:MAG: hypothetical protein L6265_13015 [Thermoplasmatales archaeon]|nr:hypothetical protein [Thermoplasmatales archaeon]
MNKNINEIKKNLKKLRYAYDKIMRIENLRNVKDVYRHPTSDRVKELYLKYKKQIKISDDELWSLVRSSKINKNIFRYDVSRYRQITGDFIKYIDFLNELKSFKEGEMEKAEERKKMKKAKVQDTIKEIDKEISGLKLKRKEFGEYKKKRLEDIREINGQRDKIIDMERKMIKRIADEYRKYGNLVELFSDEKLAEFLNPKVGRLKIDGFRVKEIGNMDYLDEKELRIFYEALEKLTNDEMKKVSRQVKHADELITLKTDLKKLFNAMEKMDNIKKERMECEKESKRIRDEMDYKEKLIDDEEEKLLERKRKIALYMSN